ncbi:MAG: hypothetical protein WBN70_09835 [Polyangiales bacterium]
MAQRPERALDTRLAVDLGRGVFRFEERPNGSRNVLCDAEYLFWNVRVFLERFERFSERFPSLPRFARR